MEDTLALQRFDQAAEVLPSRLRRAAMALPPERRAETEEFRLRTGQTMTLLLRSGELDTGAPVEPGDLDLLCDQAAEFSRYAAIETLRQGYLPLRGGGRVGLCGTAVMKDGECANLKSFSSACIRVPHEQTGIALPLLPDLWRDGRFPSTLILAPPGGGKTTLLRDLIRCLSAGEGDRPGLRVALADERGEVAVSWQGTPQLDVGPRTDVLDGCPKALAIPILLRTMGPQVIAVDEITLREDVRAMAMAANCGVALVATIHASCVEELKRKPVFQKLLAARVFQKAVIIRREAGERRFSVEDLLC